MMEVSLETARKLTLLKQGFHSWHGTEKESILNLIRQLGCLQIDTINVVERSHYLALWSRLGSYDKSSVDELLHPDRKLFEYWAHAACLIPLEHYRFFMPVMKLRRQKLKARAEKRLGGKAHLLDDVLGKICEDGPLCSADFKQEGGRGRKAGWWNWKPAKVALEMFFNAGILMVTFRRNFRRYYDLAENVLPSDVDVSMSSEDERRKFFIESAFNAWGIASPTELASYFYDWSTGVSLKGKPLEASIEELVKEDVLSQVTVRETESPYYILTKDIETAKKLEAEALTSFRDVTFLPPFDNLTWSRARTETFFSFSPKIEAYFPQNKRQYGYYNMNVLYKDNLVGRIDPKIHRKQKLLEVKLLHLKADFKPDSEFKEKLKDAFASLMEFLKADKIVFDKVVPAKLKIEEQFS
jgi:uncharacterized protein YcaQ